MGTFFGLRALDRRFSGPSLALPILNLCLVLDLSSQILEVGARSSGALEMLNLQHLFGPLGPRFHLLIWQERSRYTFLKVKELFLTLPRPPQALSPLTAIPHLRSLKLGGTREYPSRRWLCPDIGIPSFIMIYDIYYLYKI